VKSNNLDKGSEIDIDEKENVLEISVERKEKKKELKINIQGYSPTAIRSILTNAYRLSYDKIIVEYSSEKESESISQTLKRSLIGFEMVAKTEKYSVIENITEPSLVHSDVVFMRLLHNIKELLEATKRMMNTGKEHEYIKELEENIQRYDNFCRRSAISDTLMTAFYKEVSQAQREIYLIAQYLNTEKTKVSKETQDLYDTSIYVFEKLREAYSKKDISMLEEIHIIEKEIIYDKGYKLLKTKKGAENIIIFRTLTAIRMFYLSVSPLIGMILLSNGKQ